MCIYERGRAGRPTRVAVAHSRMGVGMVRKFGFLVLFFSSLAIGVASAAPCPNVVGTWNFTLQCVRADVSPPGPVFGSISITGIVAEEQACAFAGDLGSFGPNSWVGVLDGRKVTFNWETPSGSSQVAVGTGEVSANDKQMTISYTSSEVPPTACTGVGIKQ